MIVNVGLNFSIKTFFLINAMHQIKPQVSSTPDDKL